jgi:hypothetical protein
MRMLRQALAASMGAAAYALIMVACFAHVDEERYAIAGIVTAIVAAFMAAPEIL